MCICYLGGITLFAVAGQEANTSNDIVRNNKLERNGLDGIEVSGE